MGLKLMTLHKSMYRTVYTSMRTKPPLCDSAVAKQVARIELTKKSKLILAKTDTVTSCHTTELVMVN